MPKNVDEIVVGANGTVRVAPDGTAIPADIGEAYDAAFVDLGYLSEDGVKLKDAKTITDIKVWQLFYAARKLITERDLTVNFVLRQWSGPQVEFAFGGATVASDGSGGFIVTPPSAETLDIRVLAVDWQDGDYSYRFIVERGIVTDDVETSLVRTAAADLPIGFSVLGSDTGDPWTLYTDNPYFAEAT